MHKIKQFQHKMIYITFFLIFILFVIAVSKYTGATFLSMLLVHVVSFLILIMILNKLDKRYRIPFLLLLLGKYTLLLYDSVYKKLPLTSADYMVFHNFAKELLNQVDNIFEVWFVTSDVDLFVRFVAFIYGLFSDNITQIYFFVFVISMLVVLGSYLLSLELTEDKRLSQFVLLILMVMPTQIMYSITYLREMHIQFFLICSIYFLVRYIKNNSFLYMALALFFSMLCSATHSGMIVMIITVLLTILMYNRSQKRIKFSLLKSCLLVIGIIILSRSPLWNQIAGRFSNFESFDEVVNKASTVVEANTTYTTLKAQNNFQFIFYTPYKALLFALAPLPWHISGISGVIVWVIDALPKAFILSYVIRYFIFYKSKVGKYELAYKQFFFILFILFYFMYGNGTDAYGTAMRHRLKVLPLEIILMTTYLGSVYYNGRFKIRPENKGE